MVKLLRLKTRRKVVEYSLMKEFSCHKISKTFFKCLLYWIYWVQGEMLRRKKNQNFLTLALSPSFSPLHCLWFWRSRNPRNPILSDLNQFASQNALQTMTSLLFQRNALSLQTLWAVLKYMSAKFFAVKVASSSKNVLTESHHEVEEKKVGRVWTCFIYSEFFGAKKNTFAQKKSSFIYETNIFISLQPRYTRNCPQNRQL